MCNRITVNPNTIIVYSGDNSTTYFGLIGQYQVDKEYKITYRVIRILRYHPLQLTLLVMSHKGGTFKMGIKSVLGMNLENAKY